MDRRDEILPDRFPPAPVAGLDDLREIDRQLGDHLVGRGIGRGAMASLTIDNDKLLEHQHRTSGGEVVPVCQMHERDRRESRADEKGVETGPVPPKGVVFERVEDALPASASAPCQWHDRLIQRHTATE